ncbi:50S ribosomal protein L9 [Limihaloglobus sulfuriphilus]|uniref:Large ribosomal subunit protein bL9 n=1 Tax=Limihaloglobus sulfuriphilus TaxID=1851148 RepID=A0A1Q2MBQ7_9BACT|nr:50S ribosomal protein L9 [Limihaloglobus sulfuriphilus]AQQ70099.1 50S ribosomal protein L9 [Limihaloglobus sulfuriphilus]
MKVLLLDDVEKLGWLGDIVEVKDGYARNFLVPCGFAAIPSEANIKQIAAEKAARAELRRQQRDKLEAIAKATEAAFVSIETKANEQGHLFGSVTNEMIAAKLREAGYEVADKMVALESHIKQVGTYEVAIKFAADLSCMVTVSVMAPGLESEETVESGQDTAEESAEESEQDSADETVKES